MIGGGKTADELLDILSLLQDLERETREEVRRGKMKKSVLDQVCTVADRICDLRLSVGEEAAATEDAIWDGVLRVASLKRRIGLMFLAADRTLDEAIQSCK